MRLRRLRGWRHSSRRGSHSATGEAAPRSRRAGYKLALGNITTWSMKAQRYISKATADMLLWMEHHLTAEQLREGEVPDCFKAAGFVIVASPAVPTGRGGTHGGTLIAVRKHLEFKIL